MRHPEFNTAGEFISQLKLELKQAQGRQKSDTRFSPSAFLSNRHPAVSGSLRLPLIHFADGSFNPK
jgi:hypothetical protein